MGNDERPKRSWRDIDKRRDGSSGGRSSSPTDHRSGSQEDHRQKQYRAALEAAFAKGELGKLADKLNIPGLNPPMPSRATTGDEPRPAASDAGEGDAADEAAAGAAENGATSTAVDGAATATAAKSANGDAATRKNGGRKKVEDERNTLRRKLVEAAGRQEISRAAEKFLARYPLPDDHEILEQLLEHETESRVRQAIDRISELLARRLPPRRSRALCGKLKYIVETSPDSDLRQAAEGLLGRLS